MLIFYTHCHYNGYLIYFCLDSLSNVCCKFGLLSCFTSVTDIAPAEFSVTQLQMMFMAYANPAFDNFCKNTLRGGLRVEK